MDKKLTDFFNTAKDEAAAVLSQRAKDAEDAGVKKSVVNEQFGDIFRVLESLPKKDGRKFSVDILCGWQSATVCVNSKNVDKEFAMNRTVIEMHIRWDTDPLNIEITTPYSSSLGDHKVYVSTFDEARREIALGIARFAPDRVEEIGKAIDALAQEARPVAPQFKVSSP